MVSLFIDRGDEPDEFDMTEPIRKKEKAVKASFRIEMTDEERKLRDSQVTNQYHTGSTSTAPATKKMITLTKEDEEELAADRLAQVTEDGQRESSDNGQGDNEDYDDDEDPDDDLNF